MSGPDLFRLYLNGIAYVVAKEALVYPSDIRSRCAVVLGFAHGKVMETCAEGLPLSRPALLAEVASLCGEADADPVGESLIRADERGKVLDELYRWSAKSGHRTDREILDWIAEQRKAVGR